MADALFTPLVLDKIFGKLTTPELKLARSVCKTWADVGASHLGPRTILSTQLIHPYQCLDQPEDVSPLFHPKLGQSIKVLGDGVLSAHKTGTEGVDDVKNANYSSSIMKLFVQLVSKSHHYTATIDLKNLKTGGIASLIEAFSSIDFPKLVSISLHNDEDKSSGVFAVLQNIGGLPPFPEMKSLTSIKYAISLANPQPKEKIGPFRSWLEACIMAAPSLQRLSIFDNFYPDLSPCGKSLKSLEYDGWPKKSIWRRFTDGKPGFYQSKESNDEAFDLNELARMVVQVSETIETLRFGISISEIYSFERGFSFEVPAFKKFFFPNLTRLELASVEYYGLFLRTFVELGKAAPNLKHVALIAKIFNLYSDFDHDALMLSLLRALSSSGPHPKIESLALYFHEDIDSNLVNSLELGAAFPSLKYLDITTPTPDWADDGTQPETALWEKMECFNNWRNLAQLKLCVVLDGGVENSINLLQSILTRFNAGTKVITLRSKNIGTLSQKSANIEASLRLLISDDLASLTFDKIIMHIAIVEMLLWMKENLRLPLVFKKCQCFKEGWMDWVTSIQGPIDGICMQYAF